MYLFQLWGWFSLVKFSELQDQLKEKFDIDHLADIARELGVSPQAVSNWKARDRVPYKYLLKLRKRLENSDITDGDSNENLTAGTDQVSKQYGYPQYFEEDTISVMDILLTLAKQKFAITQKLKGKFLT